MSKNFNPERLLQVLVAPQISEKATYIADKNEQVVFIVTPDATKPEVKAAVEMLFKVEVKSVQIANLKGKVKRAGRNIGRRSDIRKAFVCLKPGQEINFAEGGGCLNGSRKSQTDFARPPWCRQGRQPESAQGASARQAG
jgi:large subunit ribosomal protein L23